MKNLNNLAKLIALREKGKKEVSIAQIKEIMKILFRWLARQEPIEVFKILKKYR